MPFMPDVEAVERMVDRLRRALLDEGQFHASDGLSAAMTFARRLATGVINASPDKHARIHNLQVVVRAVRAMADEIEDAERLGPSTVH